MALKSCAFQAFVFEANSAIHPAPVASLSGKCFVMTCPWREYPETSREYVPLLIDVSLLRSHRSLTWEPSSSVISFENKTPVTFLPTVYF